MKVVRSLCEGWERKELSGFIFLDLISPDDSKMKIIIPQTEIIKLIDFASSRGERARKQAPMERKSKRPSKPIMECKLLSLFVRRKSQQVVKSSSLQFQY